jgi:hypothetical protein
MLRAEELVKDDARTKGCEVKVDSKMPVRKVLVNWESVFEQQRDDVVGSFVGKFADTVFRFRD